MKEVTVTETRIGIEGSGRGFVRAEVTLGHGPDRMTPPARVFIPQGRSASGEPMAVWTAEEAAELAQVFTRIHELLDGHEKQLALRDCAGALSNTSEHGGPETPVA